MKTLLRDHGGGWFVRLVRADDGTYYVTSTDGAAARITTHPTYSESVSAFQTEVARLKEKRRKPR